MPAPAPASRPTPDGRVDRWKKLWGTPRPMSVQETEDAFDEFRDAFVPSHMHKRFLKTFGVPKAAFGNRYFVDESSFRNWNTRLNQILPADVESVEVEVVYGSAEAIEGWRLRGETRRSLRDVFIDDWFGACAVVRGGATTLYLFIEPKIQGVLVRVVKEAGEE